LHSASKFVSERLPAVTVICPNVSTNALGRAMLLADLLRNDTAVKIVGIQHEAQVWAPASSAKFPIVPFRFSHKVSGLLGPARWLRDAVGSDAVIVSKPVLHSLGLALLGGLGSKRLIVDIDDWQTGFFQRDAAVTMSAWRQRIARARSYARRGGLNGFVATRALEAYAVTRPHRLVSNRWLQKRFGGELLYHVRDPAVLDPAATPSSPPPLVLPSERVWVGFVGTARLHKGIDVLIDAIARGCERAPLGLVLMGVDTDRDPSVARARAVLGPDRFRALPTFPSDALRDHLKLADIIAIPSLDVPASWGQIPAKLFDAMSMAKPTIASAVNDIPEILDGAGLTVEPGNVQAFADALVTLACDPEKRALLGARARERLKTNYSYETGRRVILGVLRAASH
jgi:glycosyltransferase involved in cell wall biosynthesis